MPIVGTGRRGGQGFERISSASIRCVSFVVLSSSLSDLGLIFCRQSILPRIEVANLAENIAAIARGGSGEIFGHPRRGSSAALGERSAQAERIHSLGVTICNHHNNLRWQTTPNAH